MSSIQINENIHKIIKNKAILNQTTMSEVTRELLEFALENYNPNETRAESHNIIRPPFPRGGILEKVHQAFGGEMKPERIRNSRDPDAVYIFSRSCCKIYNSRFELNDDNEVIQIRKNNSRVKYVRTIFDIIYVHYIMEHGEFTVRDYKKLTSLHMGDYTAWNKFLFNVREGTFDDVICEFYNRVNNARVRVDVYDNHRRVFINNTPSGVNYLIGHEIHDLMSNCSDPMTCIYGLVRTYSMVNEAEIVIIAMNYKQLVFHDSVKHGVENNPSKRRNLIRSNNGLGVRIGGGD